VQREKYERRIVSDAVWQAFVTRYYPPHERPNGESHVAIPVFGGQPCLALAVPFYARKKSTAELSEVGSKKSPATIDSEPSLANSGHVQISAPAHPDPEQPTPEALRAAEAFLKSMLSNRATHPETYVQKVASRVGISLAGARPRPRITRCDLPERGPRIAGDKARRPTQIAVHGCRACARSVRMGQRKARSSADACVVRSAP
jgi:hypothetical protein